MTPEEQAERDAAERNERTARYYERMAKVKPTPTQRECDLTKVGALDLNAAREPDGSEPQ